VEEKIVETVAEVTSEDSSSEVTIRDKKFKPRKLRAGDKERTIKLAKYQEKEKENV